ncbi:hypothetical protein ACFQGW_07915 [Xanthomonas theicola]|uniref:hypothetical protein n=1 Tax=Xanthomonas theicola TaxID=56464 RepID=UPI000FF87700
MLHDAFHAFGHILRGRFDIVRDLVRGMADAMPDLLEETRKTHRNVLACWGGPVAVRGVAVDYAAVVQHRTMHARGGGGLRTNRVIREETSERIDCSPPALRFLRWRRSSFVRWPPDRRRDA